MTRYVAPGAHESYCIPDLTIPGTGPVTSGATVTYIVLDGADAPASGPFLGTPGGDLGNDWCATVTWPEVEGIYTLHANVAYPDEADLNFYEKVYVGALINQSGHTLGELRAAVGRQMGELTPLRATGGSLNTIEDIRNLYEPDDTFEGQEIIFTHAAPGVAGKVNRVTGNSQASTSLTFWPELPLPIVAGDRAEVYNLRGIGVRVHEIHGALNDAIRIAAGMGGQRLSAELATFNKDAPYLTIPSNFDWITHVETYSANGEWLDITRSLENRGGGYAIDRANRRIEVMGGPARVADGYQIRIRGLGKPTLLVGDEDRTMVDYEWLTKQAIASLYYTKYTRDPSLERIATSFREEADALRAKAIPGKRANAIRVGR